MRRISKALLHIKHALIQYSRFRKTVFPAVLLLLIFTSWIIFNAYFLPQSAQAAWFDDNWTYREAIPISTHSASETNVYETFQLDTATLITASKLQSSCQDIRVTDASGNLLAYHIGRTNACNNAATTIDFLIPTFASGAQTYYVYYGNPSAISKDAGAFSQSLCGNSCTTNPTLASEEKSPSPIAYWKFDEGFGTTANSSRDAQPITLVQSNINATATGSTAVTLPTIPKSGNLLVLACYSNFGNDTRASITDNQGNVFVRINTVNSGGAGSTITLYYAKNIQASGSYSVTCATANGASAMTAAVAEYSGVDKTSPLDQNATNSGQEPTQPSSGAVTTTGANELIIGGVLNVDTGNVVITGGSGYNLRQSVTDGTQFTGAGFEDKIMGAQGSQNATFSLASATDFWVASVATFRGLAPATATLTSTSWQTEDMCVSGKCLKFDGSASKATVNNTDLLNFAAADNITVSSWVKFNGASSATNYIVTKATSGTYTGYKLYMSSTGQFCFDTRDGTNVADSACSGTGFDDNQWHFIEGVKEGTTAVRIYVDGILRASDTSIASTGTLTNTNDLIIGMDRDGSSNPWKGFMDDVKVYRDQTARTATQVKADFNGYGVDKGASEATSNSLNNKNALNNGLVGYWKTDEDPQAHSGVGYNGTSGEVVDSSGNGNNGTYNGTKGVASTAAASCGCSSTTLTVSGTPWTASGLVNFKLKMTSGSRNGETSTITANTSSTLTFSPALTGTVANGDTFTISDMSTGKFSNAGTFNGLDNYSNLPNNSTLKSSQGTFAAWVKTTTDNDTDLFAATIGTVSSDIFDIELGTNASGCTNELITVITGDTSSGTNPTICATSANRNLLFDGNWHHIAVTADGTSTKIYLDGIQMAVTLNHGTDNGAFTSDSSFDSFRIGDMKYNGSEVNFFPGQIDDVRVYNRALSSADISNLYNFAPGPVGKWDFEEGTGSTVNDTSGNANTGTWNGTLGSQWKPGKYGNAGNFNGTDNTVSLASTNNFTTGTNGAWTLSAWVNTKVVDSADHIIVLYGDATAGHTPHISLGSTNKWRVSTWSNDLDGPTATANTWAYVTGVSDGTNLSLYINGVLSAGPTAKTSSPLSGGGHIGEGLSSFGPFNGKIDAVKIYNYARSQKQIIEDMNAGHPAPGSPVGTPVGWWKFNEGYGTTAHNSGNCLTPTCDGTLSGSAIPTWTQSGKFGQALVMGASGYVAMPSDLSQFKFTTQDISLSAWINLTNTSSQHDIICKNVTGTASTSSYCLFTDTSGHLNMTVTNATGPATVTTTGSITLSSSTWYHVTGVFSAGNSVTLYINGIQDTQNTSSIPSTLQNPATILDIGAENSNGTAAKFFVGTIDEPKVYSGALTANQVKLDMNYGQAQQVGAAGNNSTYQTGAANQEYCVPGDATSCVAPVGRWDFEEGSGSVANDSSGKGNTGNWNGTASWKNGKVGKAVKTSSGNDIDAGSASALDDIGQMTLEAWIYPTTLANGGFYAFLAKDSSGLPANGWHLQVAGGVNNTGTLDFQADCTGTIMDVPTTTTLNINTWYHVIATWSTRANCTASNVHLYLNGNEATYGSLAGSGVPRSDAAQDFCIGDDGGTCSIADPFIGNIDQVRVFNYVRTPAQIAWDYNKGAPVGWWKMDECTGTTIHDSSGNGNTGTLTVGAGGTQTAAGTCTTASTAWGNGATGKINSSLNFDGTDDYVSTTDSNSLMKSLTSNFTVSAWIKAADTAATERIVGNINDTTGNLGWGFGQSNGGKIRFSTFGTQDYVTTNTYITPGTWQHLVVVFTSTFSAQFYVNGVLVQTITGAQAPNNSGTPGFFIGFSPQHNEYWKGQIDDARVYNYALTSTQIQQIYNNGAVNFAPVTGAP